MLLVTFRIFYEVSQYNIRYFASQFSDPPYNSHVHIHPYPYYIHVYINLNTYLRPTPYIHISYRYSPMSMTISVSTAISVSMPLSKIYIRIKLYLYCIYIYLCSCRYTIVHLLSIPHWSSPRSLTFASVNSSHVVNNSLQLKHGHAEKLNC